MVKNPPAHAGDIRNTGSISGLGRSPGGGHDNPLKYSCLENSMDRGSWQATIHRVTKSWKQLKQLSKYYRYVPLNGRYFFEEGKHYETNNVYY